MEMDERKATILQAIIRNYLETGEPVGSRTISKYTDLNLSSATIRNEMADLEEMGYIIQPHTSAGRIPSDKGYRFYVDTMMEAKDREIEEMKKVLVERQDRLEDMLASMAEARAEAEYEELEQLLFCAHKHFGCAKKILKENLGLNKLLVVLFDTRLRFVRSYARTYFNFFNESPEDLAYDSIIDFKSKESYWQFVDEYENELFSYLEHNEFSRAAAVYECLN